MNIGIMTFIVNVCCKLIAIITLLSNLIDLLQYVTMFLVVLFTVYKVYREIYVFDFRKTRMMLDKVSEKRVCVCMKGR